MTTSSIWTPARHPLARFLREVAGGTRPPAHGGWLRVTPWAAHVQGILSFTDHAVLAVSYDHSESELTHLGVDGRGGAHHPRVITALAKNGWIGTLDVVFLGAGQGEQPGSEPLITRNDLSKHPLVEHARRVHSEVQVFGRHDPTCEDLVVLARGIAGLREISCWVPPQRRGQGRGVELVAAALRAVPENELVVACSAPAQRPSVITLERAGMHPAGTVQLFSNRPEGSR